MTCHEDPIHSLAPDAYLGALARLCFGFPVADLSLKIVYAAFLGEERGGGRRGLADRQQAAGRSRGSAVRSDASMIIWGALKGQQLRWIRTIVTRQAPPPPHSKQKYLAGGRPLAVSVIPDDDDGGSGDMRVAAYTSSTRWYSLCTAALRRPCARVGTGTR